MMQLGTAVQFLAISANIGRNNPWLLPSSAIKPSNHQGLNLSDKVASFRQMKTPFIGNRLPNLSLRMADENEDPQTKTGGGDGRPPLPPPRVGLSATPFDPDENEPELSKKNQNYEEYQTKIRRSVEENFVNSIENSRDIVEVILAMEETLDLEIPQKQVDEIMMDIIASRLASKSGELCVDQTTNIILQSFPKGFFSR